MGHFTSRHAHRSYAEAADARLQLADIERTLGVTDPDDGQAPAERRVVDLIADAKAAGSEPLLATLCNQFILHWLRCGRVNRAPALRGDREAPLAYDAVTQRAWDLPPRLVELLPPALHIFAFLDTVDHIKPDRSSLPFVAGLPPPWLPAGSAGAVTFSRQHRDTDADTDAAMAQASVPLGQIKAQLLRFVADMRSASHGWS